ncbi:hypothetical protein [Bradyrhizobium cosmicum]|uniref:hypothetical protein n=1 Tax=Bradyrhizobium cosmicum TaxID=1404864 RepID=UPI0028F08D1D|nr:hypothetical protein [Bradyrhizobium cosmicum]
MNKLEDDLPRIWDDYYYALGKFIHMFARTEDSLHAVAANFLSARFVARDVQDAFAIRAVMGPIGISAISDTLKRLLRVTKAPAPRQKDLAFVLNHLSVITTLRNRLAHNAGYPDLNNRGWFSTSNSTAIREIEKNNNLHFSTQMLLDAASDVELIANVVHGIMEPTWIHTPPPKPWNYDPAGVPAGYERLPSSAPKRTKQSPNQRWSVPTKSF